MIRKNLIIILLLLIGINTRAVDFEPMPMPGNSFRSGENLYYQLRYGYMTGGVVQLSLTDVYQDKMMMFHAVGICQTSGLADKIYGVKDIYESWFDKKTGLPYKQVRNIREGRYKWFNEVTYNRQNNTVNSKRSGVHQTPANIMDVLSMLYYIRRIDYSKLKDGDVMTIKVYFADEISPFKLRYRGIETIDTKYGKVRCHRISPVVEVGRMFKSPDDLAFWVSDDGNYIPVKVRMNIRIVGAVNMELTNYSNIKFPLGAVK